MLYTNLPAFIFTSSIVSVGFLTAFLFVFCRDLLDSLFLFVAFSDLVVAIITDVLDYDDDA